MNEDFITNGIENDRYLKAIRLVDEFETEMVRKLRNLSKDTIAKQPDLFVDDASPSKSVTSNRTEPLGHMRMDTDMRHLNDAGDQLTLNIGIEWAKPAVHGHDEPADGALCVVYYKIKRTERANYERVKQQTQSRSEWNEIQYDDDLWNTDWGIYYIPVRSGPEVTEGLETLQEHFLEFSGEFGKLPAEEPAR